MSKTAAMKSEHAKPPALSAGRINFTGTLSSKSEPGQRGSNLQTQDAAMQSVLGRGYDLSRMSIHPSRPFSAVSSSMQQGVRTGVDERSIAGSVIRSGGVLAGAATSISTSNEKGPEWGNNGFFKWWINWTTDGTSGWIVQKIKNSYSGTRADGTAITNASVGAVPEYYEAWDVSSTGNIGPLNRDQWERPNLGALGSQATMSMLGTVYWTSQDPAASGFSAGKVSNAGILLSSTSAPAGIGAPLLSRGAYGSWASDGSQMLPGCFTS